jgi:hypothetical protein
LPPAFPSPSPPPSAVSVAFTLSGDVADYDSTKQTAIREVIADAVAGISESDVTLTISAASVTVTATFNVADTATAQSTQQSLASGIMASASDLQTALQAKTALATVTVSTAPSLGWCCNPSGSFGDPHLTFANGGKADFRGSHGDVYAFISSPGYHFALRFNEADFVYAKPAEGLKQLVHGTFMTRAYWKIRTRVGRVLFIAADAMAKGVLHVLTDPGTPHIRGEYMGPWEQRIFDDVRIETRMLTAMINTSMWEVNVTSKPIYALVAPFANDTYESYHGRWEPDQRRLDISIHGAFPQLDAHGVIGQSYQDTRVRNGKLDQYDIEEATADTAYKFNVSSDGRLPPMTTSAQAEGAIDGIYSDYQVKTPSETAFAYSRYDRTPVLSPEGTVLQTIFSAASEQWDGTMGSVQEL